MKSRLYKTEKESKEIVLFKYLFDTYLPGRTFHNNLLQSSWRDEKARDCAYYDASQEILITDEERYSSWERWTNHIEIFTKIIEKGKIIHKSSRLREIEL